MPAAVGIRRQRARQDGGTGVLEASMEGDRTCVEFDECDANGFASCRFFAFDTVVSMRVPAYVEQERTSAALDALEGAVGLCRRFERLLSRTLVGSDVWGVNRSTGELVEVDFDTWEALRDAKRFSAESEGAFDFTMGGVTCLWDFRKGVSPDRSELAEALGHVGWRKIELFETGGRSGGRRFVRKADALTCVDVGGTAKGLIADRVCAFLREAGMPCGYVDLGGNIAVFGGKPDGTPWLIGVRDPFGCEDAVAIVALRDGSVVTSGVSERSFLRDGALRHHILDPTTGMPVDADLASATLVAPTSVEADGRSTMIFALGLDRAIRYVEGRDDLEAVLVDVKGNVHVTSGLL
ncbi:FAD:protein FMN transferase [Eggerthella sp. HF-4214]|uniref:FAD:protein FMN transferase n=1 Tax=Eggerthella guodeyinii TaxID=2690837 RepID=A0A6N7RPI9_9ACTN|nr:FAD:protein FMN transferase [Eggerthella guodeyinii]